MRALVELVAREYPCKGPVAEIGAFRVEGQEKMSDLSGLIPGAHRVGLDLRAGPGVDVVADGASLPLADESFPTVLVLETVEHAGDPMAIAREAFRVCAPGGCVLLTTVLDFRIHNHPHDYFRFTPGAIGLLLGQFPVRVLGFQGHPKFPHSVFGLGVKCSQDTLGEWTEARVKDWEQKLTATARFQRSPGERLRIRLASLIHGRALRSYLLYNHVEMMLETSSIEE